MKLHLLDLGGDKRKSKKTRRPAGATLEVQVPFGYRRGDSGELYPHQGEQAAIREMVALKAARKPLRATAGAMNAEGHALSHEGVAGVLRAAKARMV